MQVVSRQLIFWAVCLLAGITLLVLLPQILFMRQALLTAAEHYAAASASSQEAHTAGPKSANDYTSLAWRVSWPDLIESIMSKEQLFNFSSLQSKPLVVWHAPRLRDLLAKL